MRLFTRADRCSVIIMSRALAARAQVVVRPSPSDLRSVVGKI